MSQQINLLTQRREPIGSALLALASVALMLVGLLAYWSVLLTDSNRLQQSVSAGQQESVRVKALLQAAQQRQTGGHDGAALKAELVVLRPQAEAVRQLVDQLRSGTLGSREGYASHLTSLASISEDGLWLTNVAVSNAGKVVRISGRALRNESVMRYAGRLNAALAAQGVQFNSLEMTPESLARAGEPGKPVLTTVAFKLF